MNAVLTRSAIALFAFAGVVACSAAPETIASSSGELSAVGAPGPAPGGPVTHSPPVDPPPPPPPTPPAWPMASEPYCSSDLACSVDPAPSPLGLEDPAHLVALGCTHSYGLSGVPEYPFDTAFAVCFDTTAVRAALTQLIIGCDHCLPLLPAGQIYVDTSHLQVKPNCPSGCPGGGTGTSSGGKTTGGGSTSATK